MGIVLLSLHLRYYQKFQMPSCGGLSHTQWEHCTTQVSLKSSGNDTHGCSGLAGATGGESWPTWGQVAHLLGVSSSPLTPGAHAPRIRVTGTLCDCLRSVGASHLLRESESWILELAALYQWEASCMCVCAKNHSPHVCALRIRVVGTQFGCLGSPGGLHTENQSP